MAVDIIIEMSEKDYKKLEQAFKDGKLAELGITGIGSPVPKETQQWADPALRKRGRLKPDTPPHRM